MNIYILYIVIYPLSWKVFIKVEIRWNFQRDLILDSLPCYWILFYWLKYLVTFRMNGWSQLSIGSSILFIDQLWWVLQSSFLYCIRLFWVIISLFVYSWRDYIDIELSGIVTFTSRNESNQEFQSWMEE